MLLVKQYRSGDFRKACLHILRSVVRPLAPPLTQDSAGVEPSRQADPCVLAGLQNAGRFAQAGREVTECVNVNDCANFLHKQPAEPALQALKSSGVQSADRFMTDACISVFRLPTDQNHK